MEGRILDGAGPGTRDAAPSESNRLYEQAVRSAQEGVIVFDLERRYLVWNPFMERVMGVPASEVLGRRTEDVFPHLELEGVIDAQRRALAGESIVLPDVLVNSTGSRRRSWFSVHYSPLLDEQGRISGVICIVRDITERKAVEEQLRQSQKMEAVGRLAGGIAHDFNNLLTAINGYATLAIEESPAEGPLREFLNEILKAGRRGAELTGQLLSHSRKQSHTLRVWKLNDIVSNVESMLRRLLGADVHLVTALDERAGAVRVDRGQIEQVVMNLAVNARQAMPTGGTLRIETSGVTLDDAYAQLHPGVRPGPYALLALCDTGAGMTEEVKSHIFEPFFTTKELGKGTGLGLAIVYGIVKQYGGIIDVESEPGHGAVFRVYLPTTEVVAPELEISPLQVPPVPCGREAILVVEDEGAVRAVVSQTLRRNGYEVYEAEGGEEALRMVAGGLDVSLVITDVIMPDMSGPTLGRILRDRLPSLRVLYTSGASVARLADDDLPPAHFLAKPFSPEDLSRKLRQVLDAR